MIRSGMVAYHTDLEPLLVDIDTVHPSPQNYNNGDVDAIAESIEVNGMYRAIYVHRDTGDILAGNHTWMACKQLGATQIPVLRVDGDQWNALRIMITDNRTAQLAVPDEGQLLVLLEQLIAEDSLLGTGWTTAQVEVLRNLDNIPNDYGDEHADWPTMCFTVPPHIRHAYYTLTEKAVGDRERLELLLRLAGWEGEDL